jgi:hypothetical protein
MHLYERGYADLSIEEELVKERKYIDQTRYCTQVLPYIKKFGRDSILLIDFEDLVNKTEEVVEQVSEFLSIDAKKFYNIGHMHSNMSLKGNKRHYKFDRPSLPLRVIRKVLPPLWNMITDNSKRIFLEKPKLNIEYKEMIINMLELEIKELQKLMKKDFSRWMIVN